MDGTARALLALLVVFALELTATEESAANNVVLGRNPCAAGCGRRGNCNYEEGRCECPWGYTGPSCEVDRMAVCRMTPDDPASCGFIFPKNCECHRECFRLYCHYGTDVVKCVHQNWGASIADSPCWLYGNNLTSTAARPQNSSWYPEAPENNTLWFKQIPEIFGKQEYTPDMVLTDPERLYKSPWHRPKLPWHHADHTAHPLTHCRNNCSNGRGFCIQYQPTEDPRCTCHLGFQGDDCSQTDNNEACWFSPNCSGHGVCHSGFCHCQDGWWGRACHRSRALLPRQPGTVPDLRVKTRFKIYMYEVPWEVAFPFEVKEDAHTRDPMYCGYERFLLHFLADDAVRTENPYEATLFYLPVLAFYYAGNVANPQWQAETVINYVRQTWPFYNRTGGRDHFLFLPGDRGSCEVRRWMQDSVIKLVHFGMQKRNLTWVNAAVDNKDYACIQLKRDLVIPTRPTGYGDVQPFKARPYYNWVETTGGHDGNRTLLFFFAGGVGDGDYSGGARLAIQQLLRNVTQQDASDVQFYDGSVGDKYVDLLRTSKFCVAPYGYGWGIRLVQSVYMGCIPLIIQDHVYQPFEDFLPYEEFSVRMRVSDVPHMVELLRAYSEEQLAALRLGLARYYRAFIWEREWGGTAYEWTLAGLQRRAYNLDGEYYSDGHRSGSSRRQLLRGGQGGCVGGTAGPLHG